MPLSSPMPHPDSHRCSNSTGPISFSEVCAANPDPQPDGATDLLTLFGAEHGLGGIQGYNDTRTTDESPERVTMIQQATLAYLLTALGVDDGAWPAAREAVAVTSDKLGRIDSK